MLAAMKPAATMWALGDYHAFAKATVWQLGPVLVEACGVRSGHRVLDVAAGTGNVAIRAARAGASVVAADAEPAMFEAGRREAHEHGVEVEWVEADAQALPFADASFDIVTSAMGVMFALDHQRAADELVRVCRPGGTIGLITFAHGGATEAFFALVDRFAPPTDDAAQPPLLWGDERHVEALFGDRVSSLRFERREYVERAASAEAYAELFHRHFGPFVAIRSRLDAADAATFDRALADMATHENRGPAGGPAAYPYGYALIVATL